MDQRFTDGVVSVYGHEGNHRHRGEISDVLWHERAEASYSGGGVEVASNRLGVIEVVIDYTDDEKRKIRYSKAAQVHVGGGPHVLHSEDDEEKRHITRKTNTHDGEYDGQHDMSQTLRQDVQLRIAFVRQVDDWE